MTLDASGNLGLGVTPSAWSGSYKAIQISSYASITQGGNDTYIGNNWYNDGTNKYLQTNAASLYGQSGGSHIWYNAPSGTAGNAISFTQAMTLDASGNLGVGTSVNTGSRINAYISEAGATPNAILRLQNSGNSYLARMILTDGVTNDGVIGYQGGSTSATQYLGFGLGVNPTQMILTAAGNVGIGTTSPSNALTIFVPSSSSKGLMLSDGTDVASFTYSTITGENRIGGLQSYVFPTFYSGGSERMRITSGGNVGIGTATASSALSGDARVLAIVDNATANVGSVRVYGAGTATSLELYGGSSAVGLFGSTNHPMVFSTNNTERMRITSGGELLINTTTDAGDYKLQVNGNGLISGAITTAAPSGGTAKPFKIGAAATVTPTSPNRTIEIEIDGVIYYLTAKTTND
jgi:hypothetical protein